MSDRQTLREYQQALFERMRTQGGRETPMASRLGLEAGSRKWLMRLEEAQEVISVAPLTSVPLTKSWFRGLANIRGNLFSVVDLGAFAGAGLTTFGPEARLVLLADRFHVNAALLVQRLIGLRSVTEFDADHSAPADQPWLTMYRDASGEHWHELSIHGLARQPDFLQAGI